MTTTDWPVGGNTRHFSSIEATYATTVFPVAADAFLPSAQPTVSYSRPNILREDRQGSIGHSGTRQDRQAPVSVSIEEFIRASGAAGTPPDFHPGWIAALPVYTVPGGVSNVYTADNTVVVPTIQYTRFLMCPDRTTNAYRAEQVGGMLCDSAEWTAEGTSPPKFSSSYSGSTHSYFFRTSLQANEAAAQTALSIATGTGHYLSGNSVWKIGFFNPTTGAAVDDNGGTGYTVSAVSGDTWTISDGGGLVIGAAAGDEIRVIVPAETVSSQLPMAVGGHTFTYAAVSHDIKGFKLSLTTNGETKNDEVTSVRPHDGIRAKKREYKLEFSQHWSNDRSLPMADLYGTTSRAVALTLGGTAGAILAFALPVALPTGEADQGTPEDGQAMPTMTFHCLESAAAAGDEVTATWT